MTTGALATTALLAGTQRFDADSRPEPVEVRVHREGFVAEAWLAPAVLGVGQPGGSMGAVSGRTSGASGEVATWTLGVDRSGLPTARFATGGTTAAVVARGVAPLPTLEWSHCAVVVDLAGGTATLFVDGVPTEPVPLPERWPTGRSMRVTVGSAADRTQVGAVTSGWFVGVLADVRIRPAGPVREAPAPTTSPADVWLTDPARFDTDLDRPRFHFLPPAQWMNEPHGVVHHRGRHHLFYQRNELGPFWGNISWGHAVSDDLVRWTDLGSNLTPWEIDYARDGVWSGSATTDEDGTPLLFFTAGDWRDHPNQRTAWARPADPADPDLRRWQEAPAPVTTLTDAVPGLAALGLEPLPGEFRDPFVWREGGLWFQLVGAGIQGRGGAALLFRSPSPTATRWEFLGPLAVGDSASHPDTGVHWELPVLVPVGRDADGRLMHALLVTPWWPEPTEHSLMYQWYWLGTWDAVAATWSPDHDEPRLLDIGGHLTGATSSVDPTGRTLLWTITQDLLPEAEHLARGWAGNAGLPVVVRYEDGELRVAPIEELASLRGSAAVELSGEELGEEPVTFAVGPMWELELAADLPDGQRLVVAIRRRPDGSAAVVLAVERRVDEVVVTVRQSADGRPTRAERRGSFMSATSDPVRIRVFADHSMVEAFVQDTLMVTTRAWAADEEDDVAAVTVPDGAVRRLRVWPLEGAVVTERRSPGRRGAGPSA